jgi:hypothetical protein
MNEKIYLVSFTKNNDGLNTDVYATDADGIKEIIVSYYYPNGDEKSIIVDMDKMEAIADHNGDPYTYYIYELNKI